MLCTPSPSPPRPFNLLKSKHICTKTETTRDLKGSKETADHYEHQAEKNRDI